MNSKELAGILSLRKEKAKEAEQLMLYSLFEEAVEVNLAMIDINPGAVSYTHLTLPTIYSV